MDYVQIMFALSPFPAYLPQWYSMMQQLSPTENVNVCDGSATNNAVQAEPGTTHLNLGMETKDGDNFLRKRYLHDSPTCSTDDAIASPPHTGGSIRLATVPGTDSKPLFEQHIINQNGTDADVSPKEGDTGMSRATVLLLLSAHLLRLLYFHGIVLEEQRPIPPRAGAGGELDELIPKDSASDIHEEHDKTSALQWDLLGQSLSMIIVQLMLLHSMMLIRRKHLKRQRSLISDSQSSDSLSLLSPSSESISPRTNINLHNINAHSMGNNNDNSSNMASFCRMKLSQLYSFIKAHLYHIFSPHNILHKHSFLEYLEVLFLCSMAVKLVFDYHWYPRYRMAVVEWLKHASIVLESCLALPQAWRNHR